ncbi:MAG: ExbD/TolR family protein [Arcobacter sp.]|jgi:biopolymer transport protein ExbD|uniref:TonB system transport protein ExbD n=1 Tax=Arcobacter defluvii TaxID=873191 RepID=A0AAE7BHR5_9BACT|nr:MULTISPECIES: biopolymer transporter ExbD [Arcobacter]MDY3199968.1 biopolymer transporter ExbD [Arcobacter sp.]QKF78181.1 TonB system transport protein ExbD [Arcobacter defluvii]RXI33286.1 biopolymer transporter ExbD [Arcobacter defluvii]BAK73998.1 biopolymer transport protein [Arcobacter sp. L]
MKVKKFDSMNVIPFIDIILVLLAIVLIFSTFIAQGRIEITLPKASTNEQTDLKFKELIIDANGQLVFEKENLEIKQLKQLLQTLPKDTPISLKADENTPFKTFVQIIDIFKELKMDKISIITELQR